MNRPVRAGSVFFHSQTLGLCSAQVKSDQLAVEPWCQSLGSAVWEAAADSGRGDGGESWVIQTDRGMNRVQKLKTGCGEVSGAQREKKTEREDGGNASNEASFPRLFNIELMLSGVIKRSQTWRYSLKGGEREGVGWCGLVWAHSHNAPLCLRSHGPILPHIPRHHPLYHQICSRPAETGGPAPPSHISLFFCFSFFELNSVSSEEKGPSGDLVVRSAFSYSQLDPARTFIHLCWVLRITWDAHTCSLGLTCCEYLHQKLMIETLQTPHWGFQIMIQAFRGDGIMFDNLRFVYTLPMSQTAFNEASTTLTTLLLCFLHNLALFGHLSTSQSTPCTRRLRLPPAGELREELHQPPSHGGWSLIGVDAKIKISKKPE